MIMDNIKLLFLDIDGVLNHGPVAEVYSHGAIKYTCANTEMEELDEEPVIGFGVPKDKYCRGFTEKLEYRITLLEPPIINISGMIPECIQNVVKLCQENHVKIVLSSYWRSGLNLYEIRRIFTEIGIPTELLFGRIGPVENGTCRQSLIESFIFTLENSPEKLIEEGLIDLDCKGRKYFVESFCVVDDEVSNFKIGSFIFTYAFVFVSPSTGFSRGEHKKAEGILRRNVCYPRQGSIYKLNFAQ